MKHFSITPSLLYKGREFKGLRGFAGKPFHPPLTDIPIAAYLFAAVFDLLSLFLYGSHEAVARELFHAATWVLIGGAAFSVLAAVTGWADWHRGSTPGTQSRRTINTHATIMLTVTTLILIDLAVRLSQLGADRTPLVCVVLSVVAAALVTVGAVFGGALVFEHGFNVETAQDSAVFHASESDVYPEEPAPQPVTASTSGSSASARPTSKAKATASRSTASSPARKRVR